MFQGKNSKAIFCFPLQQVLGAGQKMLASAVMGGEHPGRIATRSGVVLLALAVTAPSAESFAFTPGVTSAAGSRMFSTTPSTLAASSPARAHSLASASDLQRPRRCRGTILMGRAGRGADGDDEEGGALAGRESSTRVGKGVRVLQKLLDKLERRAEKIEDKISRKVAKWDGKLSSKLGKSDKGEPLSASEGIKGALVKASKSPYLVPVAIGVSVLAVPASLTAFTIMMIAAQVGLMVLSPLFVLIGAAFTLAQPLIVPRLLPALSLALTFSSSLSAGLLAKYPSSRTLPAMSMGTLLPIVAWWISTIPSRSLQLVSLAGTMDPMRPFALDPFFRPFLTDPFFRDLWHLLPRPVLFTTPTTVLIRKTTAMPLMEVKIALSVASLLVVAFCWYKNGREILGFKSSSKDDLLVMDAESSVVDEDEIEEEEKERVLREWETKYKIRPEAASVDPRTWSVDELSYQMERAGLGDVCVGAFKKAGIDGRVALSLTAADEAEIRDELGVKKLGERKKLIIFLDDLRAASTTQSTAAGAESPADAEGGGPDSSLGYS